MIYESTINYQIVKIVILENLAIIYEYFRNAMEKRIQNTKIYLHNDRLENALSFIAVMVLSRIMTADFVIDMYTNNQYLPTLIK